MRRLALLLALAAAGCAPPPLEEPLLVVGPRPLQPAVQALIAASGRGSSLVDGQGASTADILAAQRGAVDVAFTDRDLLPEEDTEALRAYLLAREGVAFAVHPSNPARAVPLPVLEEVLAGRVTDWGRLGGAPGPIRAALAGERVKDLVAVGATPVLAPTEAAVALTADPGALVLFPSAAVPAGARLLEPDGVPLDERSLLSGRYPVSRSYFMVVQADAPPATQEFLQFCLGPRGGQVLAKQGLARVD